MESSSARVKGVVYPAGDRKRWSASAAGGGALSRIVNV